MGDLVGKVQVVDAGVVMFDVGPESAGKVADDAAEGAVVHARSSFLEVSDEQVADRSACQPVPVDQFGGGSLTVPQCLFQRPLRQDPGAGEEIPRRVGARRCTAGRPKTGCPVLEDVLGVQFVDVTPGVQHDLGNDVDA